jgi:hypothetical protein
VCALSYRTAYTSVRAANSAPKNATFASWGELQQPGILRPQTRRLSLNRHRDLTHDDTLSANDRALNRHQRKRMIAAK